MSQKIPVVGISIGDLNGIGPEVILGTLSDNRITNIFTPVIYASGGLISYFRKLLNLQNFNYNQCRSIKDINRKKVNVINVWEEKVEVTPGMPSSAGASFALKSLHAATDALVNNEIDALMTAPFSKELVQQDGFNFPGHTEYITQKAGSEDGLMLMVDGETRIGVATGHIPLSEVSKTLTGDLVVSKIRLFQKSLIDQFGITKPKIAVLGLNPHAGENGKLGSEDQNIILPALKLLKDEGHIVIGPLPADGFFGNHHYHDYDGILAMYHDQGLVPFKLMCNSHGVNFTAGISRIRTSPAHGTAFELAGKNLADQTSTRNALFLAAELAKRHLDN